MFGSIPLGRLVFKGWRRLKNNTDGRVSLQRNTLLCCAAALSLLAAWCPAGDMRASVGLGELPQRWQDDRARDLALTGLRGHRVVLTMAYAACHRICPMTMDELKRMQRVADVRGEIVDFVIVGYDPKNDSPAVWHQYRLSRGLNRDNWYFLSGSQAATEQLARQLGFPFWKYDEHVMHESRAVLFDSSGVQRAVLGSQNPGWSDVL
jgi:cytochrome oxidase Cu insertion factor (SCO1/SenC/PrrC family)